jgi:autotransporter-associated beta strand protein
VTTLSGNNSFTGGVTLTAGTLRATQANALGAGVGTLTLNGGILDLSNNSNTAFNRNTTVGADVTIQSNRQIGSLGAGVTHTLGPAFRRGKSSHGFYEL